jgi:hypothetical protein
MIYYSLESNNAFAYLLKDIISDSNQVVVKSNIFESIISNTISLVRDASMKYQFVEISAKSGKFDLVSNRTQNIVYSEYNKLAKFTIPSKKPITIVCTGDVRLSTQVIKWYNVDGLGKGLNQLFNIRVMTWKIPSNTPTITRYPKSSTVLIGETFGDKSEFVGTVINNDINSDFYLKVFI